MEKKQERKEIYLELGKAWYGSKEVTIKVRTQKNETVEIPLWKPELTVDDHIGSKIEVDTEWDILENGNIRKRTIIVDGMENTTFVDNIYLIENIESVIINKEDEL